MSYLYKSPYCKLCLETSDELIGILSDEGIHLNIDSTLQQHFRFKFEAGNSNDICRKCWLKIESFHEYYIRIEGIHRNCENDNIFVTSLDGKEQYDLSETIKGETKKIPDNRKNTTRKSTRLKRRRMDGQLPYVVETESKDNDHYWEDVNAVMNSNIDTAYLPSEETERTYEVQHIQSNLIKDFVSDDENDDAPLIIYKEKTLKTSGEILTKVEDDVTIELNNTNFDVPCDNDGDDIKDDDEDDDEFVEDVEETIPPAIIMNTAKGTKSSAKQTNKTKKRTDVRKKNYTSPGSIEITPELTAALDDQLKFGDMHEPKHIDYAMVKKYMDLNCVLCGDPFNTFIESHKHFLHKHQRSAIWRCCRIQMDCVYDVMDHMKYHENADVFSCAACNRKHVTHSKLRHHIRRFHLPIPEKDLQCTICFQKLPSQRKSLLHERRHIVFKCPHCDKIVNAVSFERHTKFAHTTTERVMCDICGKVSCDRKAYRLHYLVEHSGVDQKLQCDMCGLWAKHRKQLSKHMRKHFDTPQTCKICGKVTPNKYALSSHKSTHKEGKHKCQFCGKIYLKRKMLEEHESIHTGIKDLYSCDFCEKTFRFNSGMYAHRKKAHPVEYQQMQKKSYLECPSSK